MLTKEEFITNKVKLVEEDSIKGKILMMYPLDKEDGNSYPLMYEYEKELIKLKVKEICDKYKPKRVLEIGYGLGYTAQQFQDCGVEEHTIVEAHPLIYSDACLWGKDYPNVKIIYSFIQEADIDDNDYDLVFDDRFELVYEDNTEGEEAPRYKTKGKWNNLFTKEDRAQFKKR